MADEWRSVQLDELYEFSSGLSKPGSEFGEGYPFLSFKDVFYSTFVPSKLSELVRSTDAERHRLSIRRGDVFLTRTSETVDELGISSVALADIPNATFNGFAKRLRPKAPNIVLPEYAGYYFRGPGFRRAMYAMSSLSTRASLNNEMLARLTITFPPIEEQRAIAHVLKTLDDKIELNQQMNETLEAIARALFKSWFVDFDPVRAKSEGRDPGFPKHIADLLPNSFDDAEFVEKPLGWDIFGLDQIASFLNGLALQKYPATDGDTFSVIKIAQLRSGDTSGADRCAPNLPAAYIVDDGDVLFSWTGSLECVLWAGGKGALNQHLFKVTSALYPKWLYYFWIHEHLEEFRHIAAGKAKTMGHIQRHHLSDAKVAVPSEPLLEKLDRLFAPLIDTIWHRKVESRTLGTIRDALLPKLISGDIRVKDADRTVETAA